MPVPFFFQALLLGFQHTCEPDHLAAVSVLATSRRSIRADFLRILWRSSQWALGHGLSLMMLSVAALVFKSSLPAALSGFVELWVVGPVMILLGVLALRRASTLVTHAHAPVQAHAAAVPAVGGLPTGAPELHTHPHDRPSAVRGARVGRSFGVGMLHGAAGTGGALAIALGLAADSPAMALGILALESLGVLLAMSAYALLLVYAAKRLAERHTALLRGLNVVVGLVSIAVGVLWLQRGLAG